eukprot:g43334.t1
MHWKTLYKAGSPLKFIKTLRLLHKKMLVEVLIDGNMTESFDVKTGVKQDVSSPPTLFSIFITTILHLVKLPSGIDIAYRVDRKLFNPNRLKSKKKMRDE